MLVLDHLAVSAATLEEGAGWIGERLGVAVEGGGRHAEMGTHNRLLSLGDLYLEVIAVDPRRRGRRGRGGSTSTGSRGGQG